MNTQFTPGPWHVDPTGDCGMDWVGTDEVMVTQVFMLGPDECSEPCGVPSETCALANARLIAAAPDGYALAAAVAEHFRDTDAPLGKMARDFIAKVQP